jgi:hypothetical protein
VESRSNSGFELIDLIDNPQSSRDQLENANKELAQVFKNTFSSDQGKKALNILTFRFFRQNQSFSDNPDPNLAVLREGHREVMQFIFDEIGRSQ